MTYSWVTLPDGRISVNGIVIVPEDSVAAQVQSNVIDRWGPIVEPIAAAEGVPAPWIYGFIASESFPMGNPYSVSAGAGAQGLMQIMPVNFAHFYGRAVSPQEMQDPTINITTGARMLAEKRKRGLDLPTAAAEYNVGHVTKNNSDWGMYAEGCPPTYSPYRPTCYISNVVTRANYAYGAGSASDAGGLSVGALLLGGAAVAGGGYLLYRRYKKK